MDRIIARIKSIYIMFHNIIYIVTFHVIYETVSINIHNFAFIAKQRCHILIVKNHTNMFQIYRGCTYLRISVCWISPRVCAFLLQPDSPKRCYEYENSVSRSLPLHRISHSNPLFNPSYLPFQRIKSRTSTWFTHSSWSCQKPRCSLVCINFSRTHCSREF